MMKTYDNLINLILSDSNLSEAMGRVCRNKGAPGVDGMSTKQLPKHLMQNLTEIKSKILSCTYIPQAVRGVKIDKSGGGKRLLGIPTVVDRTLQQAIHQVLNLVYDRDFSESSFGFRPARSAHGAMEQATNYINEGRQDIVDLDLRKFFDKVNHQYLLNLLSKRIGDKVLLHLIHQFLKSGIMLGGLTSQRDEGTPQGGPLSPILSNILLDELDKELECRGHKFVRYADDVSIFLCSKRAASRVRKSVTKYLESKLYLEVNEDKTSICRPVNFELLGFGYVPTYKKGEKGKYHPCISKKSWARLKQKIKIITRKTSPIPLLDRIIKLNQLMRGWVHYFKIATGYQKLKTLDSWIRCRLRYCVWKQWKRPKRRLRAFLQLGVSPSWARRFAYSRKGGWHLACGPVMGTTLTEERLKQRGYMSFLEYYLKVKYRKTVQ